MSADAITLFDLPPSTPVRRVVPRRERVLPGQLRLCGACKGKGTSAHSRIVFWFWVRDERDDGGWREQPFCKPNLHCHACQGSGLNATPERARDLERWCHTRR